MCVCVLAETQHFALMLYGGGISMTYTLIMKNKERKWLLFADISLKIKVMWAYVQNIFSP